ncbi:MAG: photosynthetic complex assembly protein PuhC [Pseudomonadota bacterium]
MHATEPSRKELLDQRLMRVIFFGLATLLVLVAFHTYSGSPRAETQYGEILQEKAVFLDAHPRQGTVLLNADRELIAEFAPGDGGLLETLGTVLRRQRLRHDAPADTPVMARLHEGNQLSLFDPTTRHSYNMTSYGNNNVAQIIEFMIEDK